MLHNPNEQRIFPRLPEEAIEKLKAYGTVEDLSDGAVLFAEGDTYYDFWVVLEGEVRVTKQVGNKTQLLVVHHPGEFAGEISLMSGAAAIATGHADGPVRALRIDSATFRRIIAEGGDIATTILTAMTGRTREVDSQLRQQEKLAALGQLAAGLAHELNNPAAASLRAVSALQDALKTLHQQSLEHDCRFNTEQRKTLSDFFHKVQSADREATAMMDPLARSECEDELALWMEQHGVQDGWELASTLIEAGITQEKVNRFPECFGDGSLNDALCWLGSALNTTALAGDVERSTRRISELVGAMRAYSYMDRGELQEVDIHQGIEDTLTILQHKMKNGITVHRKYAADLPKIQAFGSELNQVWTNLIDNAISAMQGNGNLTICTERDHDGVVVQIVDDGPGVPEDIQDRIWEPFFTTKGVGEGTGLGLDIALRIVCRRHGGSLHLTSEPGNTCFEVRLPKEPPPGTGGS
ncbi:MAG: ATP-binding protein [Armatimonadaceae bacterium]